MINNTGQQKIKV